MKVFVTGTSRYIGGSVAVNLRAQGHEVRGLVRRRESVVSHRSAGIEPVLGALDDTELLGRLANWVDVTINAASSDHFWAAHALIESLSGTGKMLIHTSGSSIVGDDAAGMYAESTVYADDMPFQMLLNRSPRNEIDRLVRAAGIFRGMRTAVICPTMVYGQGLGEKADSDEIPKLRKKSTEVGAGVYIGEGRSIWSNVHIADLVDLYLLAVERAPSALFYFAESGELAMRDVAVAVSHSLGFGGKTQSWNVDDAVAELGLWPRIALGTNSRVRATNARGVLGWTPSRPDLAATVSANL
ncbi:NAD-dependent epimerase/dehydratase family protein [Luteibacter aegosomatissinici]|uniref:NAD-dependent epimerase/dehydratase family protein n=1 Tax=Luteibacter aegosomatissinici TaxID=2911539 RepID=UPI001FF91774|nr:NAD-dependent epimerase/dehydratase family protein [Luteibacter aegosomatissinici]UPG92745.1 NAD-dependent epimerase/dehydratase family protein [Luteibacter aegosomatissinici]